MIGMSRRVLARWLIAGPSLAVPRVVAAYPVLAHESNML